MRARWNPHEKCQKRLLKKVEPPIHYILLSNECIWNVFTTGNIVHNYPNLTFLYCYYMQWMWEKCYQVLPPYLTLVLDTFIDRHDMSDKITLLSRLLVIFRARVLDLFMDWIDWVLRLLFAVALNSYSEHEYLTSSWIDFICSLRWLFCVAS